VGKDHPLRLIRILVNEALTAMAGDFEALYSGLGRPSIAPENLLRVMLLQAFYSIRSERQLMERLEFDLLFRWFVGLGIDDAVWDHSTFSKSRDRLLEGEAAVAVGATASEAGVVYTPAPNGAFLNGITRQRVINLLRSDGVTVIETTLHYSDFENADGIFSSGNFAKVAPVIRIDGRNAWPLLYQGAKTLLGICSGIAMHEASRPSLR
jgi:hypothetical protein